MTEKESENKRHQVFISYSTEKGDSTKSDLPVAEKICSALESKGIRCWMAHRDILPGGDWLNAMIDAVMQSKVMILVFSSITNKSSWVVQEVTRALRENITIIPFKIENVSPMKGLRALEDRCQWMDAYTPPLEKHVDRLVKVVHTYLKKEPEKPLKVVEKQPEAVEVDVTKEVKKKEKIPGKVPQKKWILLAASIIVLVAIAYFFRYQLGILPEEKSPVKKTDDRVKKEDPVKKPQIDPTKGKLLMEERKTPKEKVEEMPKDVSVVKSKDIKVEKNKKGFWEAHCRDGIVMIYIPAGEFTMGSNDGGVDEKPPHKVYLDGYWMRKTEVTNAQYVKFLNDFGIDHENGCQGKQCIGTYEENKDSHISGSKGNYHVEAGYEKHPIIRVSWYGAVEYCKWLSKKVGLKFKLPTEAQWEKAARGTDGRKYPWGNSSLSGEKANFADKQIWLKKKYRWANKDIDDGYAYTAPVGFYAGGASPYGLLNMAGNVWEWCSDWYKKDYYKSAAQKKPSGPNRGTKKVFRGGSWVNYDRVLRCFERNSNSPSGEFGDVGFRLCMVND